jgi:hypothetical protein
MVGMLLTVDIALRVVGFRLAAMVIGLLAFGIWKFSLHHLDVVVWD